MDIPPTKSDIEAIFTRLRAIPTNKTCFDCNAKNPTWSSVTYGVFICIDCSAVHRSLGVHLTFVRSTQLDTNWTWLQLRQMQLGGNSNASQFFQQHNCITTDAQKKYNSRAAQLYRDKLSQLASNALRTNSELHIHPHEEKREDKEIDFFTEQETFHSSIDEELKESQRIQPNIQKNNQTEGPSVNLVETAGKEPIKSTITARKPTAKKAGLGAKKGGLGATKVKTNFAEIEREAEIAEETRLRTLKENSKAAVLSILEREEREAAARLAYKDLSNEQAKREEQLRKQDPKKAEQIERLGMGVGARAGISHSALSDMQIIQQENVQTGPTSLNELRKLRIADNDFFDDSYYGFGMVRSKNDPFSTESNGSTTSDGWTILDDVPKTRSNSSNSTPVVERPTTRHYDVSNTDEAQKKFGNAKAISSDQFFNDQGIDYETKANLNRFQGSSSISSAEFFGNDKMTNTTNLQTYDLEDVKESVRQGVTKVAGKISSLANGVMSSLQDRYGN